MPALPGWFVAVAAFRNGCRRRAGWAAVLFNFHLAAACLLVSIAAFALPVFFMEHLRSEYWAKILLLIPCTAFFVAGSVMFTRRYGHARKLLSDLQRSVAAKMAKEELDRRLREER